MLRDDKMAAREDCRVGQNMTYFLFGFAKCTVLALGAELMSMCRSSIVIAFRFHSKTQWRIFLVIHGDHVDGQPTLHVCYLSWYSSYPFKQKHKR